MTARQRDIDQKNHFSKEIKRRKWYVIYSLPVAERILCLMSGFPRNTDSARFNLKKNLTVILFHPRHCLFNLIYQRFHLLICNGEMIRQSMITEGNKQKRQGRFWLRNWQFEYGPAGHQVSWKKILNSVPYPSWSDYNNGMVLNASLSGKDFIRKLGPVYPDSKHGRCLTPICRAVWSNIQTGGKRNDKSPVIGIEGAYF